MDALTGTAPGAVYNRYHHLLQGLKDGGVSYKDALNEHLNMKPQRRGLQATAHGVAEANIGLTEVENARLRAGAVIGEKLRPVKNSIDSPHEHTALREKFSSIKEKLDAANSLEEISALNLPH